jgi:hypothetical protein
MRRLPEGMHSQSGKKGQAYKQVQEQFENWQTVEHRHRKTN